MDDQRLTLHPGRVSRDGEMPPAYRTDIDGLRAIAVSSVVAFHAGFKAISGGFVGVDIFFVISGFLIGGIVNREVVEDRFSFLSFYLRRAKRILPALLVVTASTCLVALTLLTPIELDRAGISFATALVGVSNIWFWWGTNYFSPAASLDPFLMTWSLGVEEQFYVVTPILLIILHRLFPRWIAIIFLGLSIVSLALSYWILQRAPTAAFYLLPSRAWELGIGVLLALIPARYLALPALQQNLLASFGFVALLGSVVLIRESMPFPGLAALAPTLGTAALICSPQSYFNRTVLSFRPVVQVGLASYSWYLWHWPLLAFVRIVSPTSPDGWLLPLAALAALVLAFLSLFYVERPFRAPTPARIRHGNALLRYGIALLVVLAVPTLFIATRGLPFRVGEQGQKASNLVLEGKSGHCLVGYGDAALPTDPTCITKRQSSVALMGDSHAAALASGLRAKAEHAGLGFVQLTKSSCPLLSGVTRYMPAHPQHAAECLAFDNAALAAVDSDRSIRTVVIAGYWSAPFDEGSVGERFVRPNQRGTVDDRLSRSQFAEGLRSALQSLRKAGKQVVIMSDVPRYSFDVGTQSVATYLPLRNAARRIVAPSFDISNGNAPLSLQRPPARNVPEMIRRAAEQVPGVIYVDSATRLCTDKNCRVASGGLPYYVDDQHLSHDGASYLLSRVPLLGP